MASDQYIGSPLQSFLDGHRVTEKGHGAEISMTGMGEIKGKWNVQDAEYESFLDHMFNWLFIKKLRPNNFVEQRRSDNITPLLVDLDFRYPGERSLTRTFTTDHIQSFVTETINVIKETFDLKGHSHLR